MAGEDSIEFTFVTYNIGGMKYLREERLQAFMDKIEVTLPDIVVIQEGTRLTYEKLLRSMGLLGYKRQLFDVMNTRETGEIMFSKFPILSGGDIGPRYLSFKKTSENRGISCIKIEIGGTDRGLDNKTSGGTGVWICTSQFDDQTSLFRMQVNEFTSILRTTLKDGPVIFGGDTRILEYQNDLVHPDGWCDAWYEAGTEDNKYTYDSKKNLLTKPPFRDRPDRVWFRSYESGWPPGGRLSSSKHQSLECVECKLYGNDNPVAISPHYGVWVKFRLVK